MGASLVPPGSDPGDRCEFVDRGQERPSVVTGGRQRRPVRVSHELFDSVPPLPDVVRASLASDTLLSEKFLALSAGSPVWECPLHDVPVKAADLLTVEIGDQPAATEYTLYIPIVAAR